MVPSVFEPLKFYFILFQNYMADGENIVIIKILSIGTERSEQTVQAQISSQMSSLIRATLFAISSTLDPLVHCKIKMFCL